MTGAGAFSSDGGGSAGGTSSPGPGSTGGSSSGEGSCGGSCGDVSSSGSIAWKGSGSAPADSGGATVFGAGPSSRNNLGLQAASAGAVAQGASPSTMASAITPAICRYHSFTHNRLPVSFDAPRAQTSQELPANPGVRPDSGGPSSWSIASSRSLDPTVLRHGRSEWT